MDPAQLLRHLHRAAPLVIYAKDNEGRFVLSNPLHAQMLGRRVEEVVGRFEHDLLGAEEAEEIARITAHVVATGSSASEEFCLELPGGKRYFWEQIFPLRDASGALVGVGGVATDITRRREAELATEQLREQLIHAQAKTLAELAAPVMRLGPGIIVVPLIGEYDHERGDHMVEVMTDQVAHHHARHVIIDCSGLRELDGQTAELIGRSTRLIELLGARAILTGISPEVARRIIEAAIDLGRVHIEPSLGEGLAHVQRSAPATNQKREAPRTRPLS